jgi:hypothetical protein
MQATHWYYYCDFLARLIKLIKKIYFDALVKSLTRKFDQKCPLLGIFFFEKFTMNIEMSLPISSY